MTSINQQHAQTPKHVKITLVPDPRTLSCGHCFSLRSLTQLAQNNTIICPRCRNSTILDERGPNGLTKNFPLLQVAGAGEERKNPEAIICALCFMLLKCGGGDGWSCTKCKNNLCNACTETHRASFTDHTVVSLEKVKCPTHFHKQQTHICIDCDMAVCSICVRSKHRKHVVEEAGEYLGGFRESMEDRWVHLSQMPFVLVADKINKQLNVGKLEGEVFETFTRVQHEMEKAAEDNITRIRAEQTKMEENLAVNKNLFRQFIDSVKEAKKLHAKIAEHGTLRGLDIAVPQEALTTLKKVSDDIDETTIQVEEIENQLRSLSSMRIPTNFSASTQEHNIGVIEDSLELQPGFDLSMLDTNNYISLKADRHGAFGFRILNIGGTLYLGYIQVNKPARHDGRLRDCDKLLAINGTDCSVLTLEQVKEIIRAQKDTITLMVKPCPEMIMSYPNEIVQV